MLFTERRTSQPGKLSQKKGSCTKVKGHRSNIPQRCKPTPFGNTELLTSLHTKNSCPWQVDPQKKAAAQRSKVTDPKFHCIAHLPYLGNISSQIHILGTYSYRPLVYTITSCSPTHLPRQTDTSSNDNTPPAWIQLRDTNKKKLGK